ncbi:TIM barrel protein [Actinosynnema pretiosum subsp. pretiosum]|uniref:TIM barrel protein n=1 Tax=Actinosynnema pretiosum subsp. pretiosum TaxID=103721 RepID=A0AA45LA03_9PSEU|nr:hypothetical protein APASM_2312 [Actinosynnema pretiosum subsp. pretiosum]QUF06097.1 TIM barrel protein [Actinosynnema pretiosum subsp. pretiosum]
MITAGLASVGFPDRPLAEVVELALGAGAGAVAWGGDVHVPAGDLVAAERAAALSEAAGLVVGVYGSGYRAGCDDPEEFAAVLDSAQSLGAPGVLVRAGGVAPWEATVGAWSFVVAELRRCVRLAAERDLVVVAEHSATSLFGTLESALRLLAAVPGLAAHWRALGGSGAVLAEVSALLPSLVVLSCGAGDPGASAALELLARDGGARMALLEPASGDATAVVRDGRALLALLERRS